MRPDTRRRGLFAALMLVAAGAGIAQSNYPNRPVRMVVPSSAGGGADIVARIVAPRLAERLGQQVSSITGPARAP